MHHSSLKPSSPFSLELASLRPPTKCLIKFLNTIEYRSVSKAYPNEANLLILRQRLFNSGSAPGMPPNMQQPHALRGRKVTTLESTRPYYENTKCPQETCYSNMLGWEFLDGCGPCAATSKIIVVFDAPISQELCFWQFSAPRPRHLL